MRYYHHPDPWSWTPGKWGTMLELIAEVSDLETPEDAKDKKRHRRKAARMRWEKKRKEDADTRLRKAGYG